MNFPPTPNGAKVASAPLGIEHDGFHPFRLEALPEFALRIGAALLPGTFHAFG